jgi:hypothetical protein
VNLDKIEGNDFDNHRHPLYILLKGREGGSSTISCKNPFDHYQRMNIHKINLISKMNNQKIKLIGQMNNPRPSLPTKYIKINLGSAMLHAASDDI